MATYKRLSIGERPVVLAWPEWLLHDDLVGGAYRALNRALVPPVPVYVDSGLVVVIIPVDRLADDAVAALFHALVDELTVWRLATHDGTAHASPKAGVSAGARSTRFGRERGMRPMRTGWGAA